MKRMLKEENLAKLFGMMATLLFALLFCFSIRETWVNDYDLVEEYVSPVRDSLAGNAGWLLLLLIGSTVLYRIGKHAPQISMNVVAVIISIFAFAFGVYWINTAGLVPQADQQIACEYAAAFEQGNWEGLEKGMYVGIYQHQLGLITFLRLLYRLFGEEYYQVFQYVNALMVSVLIYSGYRITVRLSSDTYASVLYFLLTGTCVPLFAYIPFVYGEVISTALVVFSAWLLLENFESFSALRIAAVSVGMGVAVVLRTNALIFVIAFCIVSLIHFLRGVHKGNLLNFIGILAGVIVLQCGISAIYAEHIPQDSLSAPASVYIAMGINDDYGIPGWHNYYDQIAFAENEYDIEKTNRAAWEYFFSFFETNKEHPGYLADFYYRKICSQWNAPMYQCFAMNNNFREEPEGLVEDIYFGSTRELLEKWMNIQQLLVYGGVLCLVVAVRNRWKQIDGYLLLIGVFGGFLFSLMWEAKTRYVLPYYLVLLPYAAMGIWEIVKWMDEKLVRKTYKNTERTKNYDT